MGILNPRHRRKSYNKEKDYRDSRHHSSLCSSCVERDICNRYGGENFSHYCYDM